MTSSISKKLKFNDSVDALVTGRMFLYERLSSFESDETFVTLLSESGERFKMKRTRDFCEKPLLISTCFICGNVVSTVGVSETLLSSFLISFVGLTRRFFVLLFLITAFLLKL